MSHQPHVIVVSGMPGVGKSTLARQLASHFSPGAHVEADRLQALIVSGVEHGGVDGLSDEAERQLRLRLHQSALLATSFYEQGFSAVIDDVITGARFEQLRDELGDTPFSFVMLLRDVEVLKDEWRALGSPFVDSWDWIADEIANATPRAGLWVNTTEQSAHETAAFVLRHFDDARVS